MKLKDTRKLSENPEQNIRKVIQKAAEAKYGVTLQWGKSDLHGNLRDGRRLRIEYDFEKQDPAINVLNAWRPAFEQWRVDGEVKDFVLIEVFHSRDSRSPTKEGYEVAKFAGQQMARWAKKIGAKIRYHAVEYTGNQDIKIIARQVREKLPDL